MSPILQIILVALLVVLVIYQIRMDQYNRQKMFELQIEMAKGQQAMTKELQSILTPDQFKRFMNHQVEQRPRHPHVIYSQPGDTQRTQPTP